MAWPAPGIDYPPGGEVGSPFPIVLAHPYRFSVNFANHATATPQFGQGDYVWVQLWDAASSDGALGTLLAEYHDYAPASVGLGIWSTPLPGYDWLPRLPVRFRIRLFFAAYVGILDPWSDWTSLSIGHVVTRWQVGPPVAPYMDRGPDSPAMAGSLNVGDAADYVTGWEPEAYRDTPQGSVVMWAPGMQAVAGASTRSEVDYGGAALTPGMVVRWRHRHKDRDQTIGAWSTWMTQAVVAEAGPDAMSPLSPSTKLLTRTPTLTIGNSVPFDQYQWRLFRDGSEIHDSGAVSVASTSSVPVDVPAALSGGGGLAWGDGAAAPLEWDAAIHRTGAGAGLVWSPRRGLRVDSLPSTTLTTQGWASGYVSTANPTYLSPYDDADRLAYGEDPVAKEWEIRQGGSPVGTGSLVDHVTDLTPVETEQLGATFVPTVDVAYDVRVRYRDDATPKVSTTLAANSPAGATNVKVTSVTGMAVGDQLTLDRGVSTEETRTITAVGTAGAGGSGVTVDHGFTLSQANLDLAHVLYWGPWTPWHTFTYHPAPIVAASLPADASTVNDPTRTLTWTFASTRPQASATVRVYEVVGSLDQPVHEAVQAGAGLSYQLPPYLLATGKTYAWTIQAYDELGFPGTTTRRTFATSFGAPATLTGGLATADVAASKLTLTWDASADPYLDHYRVWWQRGDATWARIDGGPETAADGNPPLLVTTLVHHGARLGANSYRIEAHNGAQASTFATVDGTLPGVRGTWPLVEAAGATAPLLLAPSAAPRVLAVPAEAFRPPGRGSTVLLSWPSAGRSVEMACWYAPEDGSLTDQVAALQAVDARSWLKAPVGYALDPLHVAIAGLSDDPRPGGLVALTLSLQEVEP